MVGWSRRETWGNWKGCFKARVRTGSLGGEEESYDGEYRTGRGEVPFSFWRRVHAHRESPGFAEQ